MFSRGTKYLMDKMTSQFFSRHLKGIVLCLLVLVLSSTTFARLIYSNSPGGEWTNTASWIGGVVPIAGDTVIIQSGHTITVTIANLYNNSTYMFLIIVGTLDLSANGKLEFR